MNDGPSPTGPPPYRFRGRPLRRDLESIRRFRSDLLHRLRLLRAGGSLFRVTWTGPPNPEIRLHGSRARHGAVDGLVGVFPAGCWEMDLGATAEPTTGQIRRFGLLRLGASLPELPTDLARSWSDRVPALIQSVGPEVRVEWEFTPLDRAVAEDLRAADLEAREVPDGFRLAPLTSPEREHRDRIERHRRSTAWSGTIRIDAAGPRAAERAAGVARILRVATESASGTVLSFVPPVPVLRPRPPPCPMTDAEVAAVLPEPDSAGPALDRLEPRPREFVVGRRMDGTASGIPVPASEGRHLLILGETGMGKSTLLIGFALAASRDASVLFFDPIGDTAREFVARLPKSVAPRLLASLPSESALEMNALAGLSDRRESGETLDRRRLDLVLALRRVRAFRYPESSFWGPRIEEVLRRALAVATASPGATLVDVERLLLPSPRSPGAALPGAAGAEIAALEDLARTRPEEVDGARRLVAEITGSAALRRLLCASTPTATPEELVAFGRIAVLAGDAGRLGETVARYLLSVHLALVWSRLVGRAGAPKVFVVLDEAQWYAHDAVVEMLALARRSNVHLVVATQSLGALSDSVRAAALANCADVVLFRAAPEDAREFGRWRPDLSTEELLALDRGEAIGLIGKGGRIDRFRTVRLPEIVPSLERDLSRGTIRSPRLDAIVWAAFESRENAPELAIPLEALREISRADDRSVREFGRLLAAAKALVGRRSTTSGPAWVIDPEAFARSFPRPDASELERARTAWRERAAFLRTANI